jgi:hypothetical protein
LAAIIFVAKDIVDNVTSFTETMNTILPKLPSKVPVTFISVPHLPRMAMVEIQLFVYHPTIAGLLFKPIMDKKDAKTMTKSTTTTTPSPTATSSPSLPNEVHLGSQFSIVPYAWCSAFITVDIDTIGSEKGKGSIIDHSTLVNDVCTWCYDHVVNVAKLKWSLHIQAIRIYCLSTIDPLSLQQGVYSHTLFPFFYHSVDYIWCLSKQKWILP